MYDLEFAARDKEAGVTLLEILVVLAIIAMIATLTAPRLLDSFGRAKSQAAQVQLANVKGALQLYYLDVGRFPSEAENLSSLVNAPAGVNEWAGPYIDPEGILDPWGRAFIYRQPGTEKDFDLLSRGRDGQPGGTKEDKDISL